jgi:hypothetical protein
MITLTFQGNDQLDIEAQMKAWLGLQPPASVAVAAPAPVASTGNGAAPPEPVEETPKPKRRKRRTKAEMEAAKKAEAEAKEVEEVVEKIDPAPEPDPLPPAPEMPHDMDPAKAHAEAVGLLKEAWGLGDPSVQTDIKSLLMTYNVSVFHEVPHELGPDLLAKARAIAAESGVIV